MGVTAPQVDRVEHQYAHYLKGLPERLSLAALPSVRKAWRYPNTESPWGYVGGMLSGLTGLATLDAWGTTAVNESTTDHVRRGATVTIQTIHGCTRPPTATAWSGRIVRKSSFNHREQLAPVI